MERDLSELSLEELLNIDEKDDMYVHYLELCELANGFRAAAQANHKEELDTYNKIVTIVANYLKRSGLIPNALSYCGALSELVHKANIFGKLSRDDETYDEEISGKCGAMVLNGKTNCRVMAHFFGDVLNKAGIETRVMPTRIISGSKDNSMIFENVLNVAMPFSSMVFDNDADTLDCNHMCITFEFDGHEFMYDPYNMLLLSLHGIEARSLNGDYLFYLCPTGYIYYYGKSYRWMLEEMKRLSNYDELTEEQEDFYLKFINDAAYAFNERDHSVLKDALEPRVKDFKELKYTRKYY